MQNKLREYLGKVLALFFPLRNYKTIPIKLSKEEFGVARGILLAVSILFVLRILLDYYSLLYSHTQPSFLLEIQSAISSYFLIFTEDDELSFVVSTLLFWLLSMSIFQWSAIFLTKTLFWIWKNYIKNKIRKRYESLEFEYNIPAITIAYIIIAIFFPLLFPEFSMIKLQRDLSIVAVIIAIYSIQANLSIYLLDKLKGRLHEYFKYLFYFHSSILSFYTLLIYAEFIELKLPYVKDIYTSERIESNIMVTLHLLIMIYFLILAVLILNVRGKNRSKRDENNKR